MFRKICFCIILIVISNKSPVQAQGTLSSTALAAAAANLTAALLEDLDFLRVNVLSFWARHGLDNEYGGIHGTLDRAGRPISPTAKGLIQQTRHIWCALWLGAAAAVQQRLQLPNLLFNSQAAGAGMEDACLMLSRSDVRSSA